MAPPRLGAWPARPCARCGGAWGSWRRCAISAATPTRTRGSMEKIIKAAVERGPSDLHIKAGDGFRARINGKLGALTKRRLAPDQSRAIALKLISSDEDRARIDPLRYFACPWGMPGVGLF